MDTLATKCAKSIAHLYMLHSVPVQPHANSLSHLPTFREGYTLPFDQERLLASVLAFLSGIEDDPSHVTAVCVKENQSTSSLEVLLAVNKGKPDDGESVLRELKQGFEKLFTELSQVSGVRADAARTEHAAFAAIVSMCSHRILCRLRLNEEPVKTTKGAPKRIKNTSKPSIKIVLKRIRQLLEEAGMSFSFPLFVATVREVEKLVDAWNNHQTQRELQALVEGFCRLQKLKDASRVMDAIPDCPTFPQSSKWSFLNIIDKVARYRECARFLTRLAKKCSLVRDMRVVLVRLPPEVFRRTPVGQQLDSNLASKALQVKSKKVKGGVIENMCRLLGYTAIPEANQAHVKKTRKTLKEAKVHAEIQLLFYREEMEKSELPPRVVCSSKDACFLCNKFILRHGKMHTPRSHGRLYPGWRLPHAGNTDLHSKFVEYLDSIIKDSISTLFSRETMTNYPNPNESTLLTLPVSTSTLSSRRTRQSATQSERNWQQQPPPANAVEGVAVEPCNLEPPRVPSGSPHSNEKLATLATTTETSKLPKVSDKRLNNNASSISPLPEMMSSVAVEDDAQTPDSVQLTETVGANRTSPFYSNGVLDVLVEYSPDAASPSGLSKQLPFSVEWLGAADAENVRETQVQHVFEADKMETEISLSLNDQNSVYISAKGSLAKLTFGRPQGS